MESKTNMTNFKDKLKEVWDAYRAFVHTQDREQVFIDGAYLSRDLILEENINLKKKLEIAIKSLELLSRVHEYDCEPELYGCTCFHISESKRALAEIEKISLNEN